MEASLVARQKAAHEASKAFDFVREGSLATFWRQATPGTTYWRGYLPMLYLPGQVTPVWDECLEWDDATQHLTVKGQEGTPIWQFLGDDGRTRIALQQQRQGTRVLMEVDDNYLRFAPPLYGKFGAWTKTHAEALANKTGYSVEMHRKIVPLMDGIICSTEQLADEYSAYNDNVYVCPNSIDPTDWDVERTESDILRIGYYGSPSHARDYPLVKKALKWAMKQPDVEVSMIGFTPPGWRGKIAPWADNLFDARKNLGAIDVGIAPLTRNLWADGKSDVKALEYAMAGVMPIVEDAPPYSPWKDMGWEWCPKGELGWSDAIHDVIEMRDDVKMFAAQAKDYVLAERTIQGNVHKWQEAIDG